MNPPIFSSKPAFPHDRLLRTSLLSNAAFSMLSGGILLTIPNVASSLLAGVPALWVQFLGATLILFAATVGIVAMSSPVEPVAALAISVADLAWVGGSLAVIVGWGNELEASGILAVLIVALFVASFAFGQLEGLRRYARNPRGRTAAKSRFDFVKIVPAKPGVVWERVRAIDRIGEFYKDLTDVHVKEENGVLKRTCSIHNTQWSETVIAMDDERRELVLEFDVAGETFPVPATEMLGGWVVAPAGAETAVHLWYEFTLKWGWLGEIMAALMATFYRRQLTPAVDTLGRSE